MELANQKVPMSPEMPPEEIRKLRARLILEEAFETVEALGFDVQATSEAYSDFVDFKKFGLTENGVGPNMTLIADGCADLKVVTVGTEIACGINGRPIFEEVMRSNMTKFIDGHLRDDGKWQKGPSYEPPRIEPILKSQGMK